MCAAIHALPLRFMAGATLGMHAHMRLHDVMASVPFERECGCHVVLCRHWMPALVLIGYWALFTGLIFLALQYLPRKPFKLCCCIHHPVAAAQKCSALCAPTLNVHPPQPCMCTRAI